MRFLFIAIVLILLSCQKDELIINESPSLSVDGIPTFVQTTQVPDNGYHWTDLISCDDPDSFDDAIRELELDIQSLSLQLTPAEVSRFNQSLNRLSQTDRLIVQRFYLAFYDRANKETQLDILENLKP